MPEQELPPTRSEVDAQMKSQPTVIKLTFAWLKVFIFHLANLCNTINFTIKHPAAKATYQKAAPLPFGWLPALLIFNAPAITSGMGHNGSQLEMENQELPFLSNNQCRKLKNDGITNKSTNSLLDEFLSDVTIPSSLLQDIILLYFVCMGSCKHFSSSISSRSFNFARHLLRWST